MDIKEYQAEIKRIKREIKIELSKIDVIEFALCRKETYYADHYDDLEWNKKSLLESNIGWLGGNVEFIDQDLRWLIRELKDLYLYGY